MNIELLLKQKGGQQIQKCATPQAFRQFIHEQLHYTMLLPTYSHSELMVPLLLLLTVLLHLEPHFVRPYFAFLKSPPFIQFPPYHTIPVLHSIVRIRSLYRSYEGFVPIVLALHPSFQYQFLDALPWGCQHIRLCIHLILLFLFQQLVLHFFLA